MNPTDRRDLEALNAFVDDELDLAGRLVLEARLGADAAFRAGVAQSHALRAAVRDQADYFPAPPALRQRLTVDVRGAAARAEPAPRREGGWRQWLAWRPLGTGFAAACALFWIASVVLSPALWPGGTKDRLAEEVIASHVRSTVGDRLVDVASSDRHTVKPWLSSRLDYSPPVADAPLPGTVFAGGRVDYLDGRPVAALVYRQRQHVIDVYVWPDSHPGAASASAMRSSSERGFNTLHWSRAGMRYWVVSDLNRQELAAFASALDRVAASL